MLLPALFVGFALERCTLNATAPEKEKLCTSQSISALESQPPFICVGDGSSTIEEGASKPQVANRVGLPSAG